MKARSPTSSSFSAYKPSHLLLTFGCIGLLSLITNVQAAACGEEMPPALLNQDLALRRVALCNRDVVGAQRNVIAGQADQQVANQTQNPTLSVGVGSISPNKGIGSGSYWDKTIDNSIRYEQLIERGGKRNLRSKFTQLLTEAAEQDVLEIKRQQGTLVLQAMVDLATTDEKVGLLQEINTLYEESLRANVLRTRVGDLAPIDAQRQEIDSIRAQIDLRQAQAGAVRIRQTLAGLLAWELQAKLLKVDPSILDVANSSLSDMDFSARPDIDGAKLRVQAALAQRDLAQAQSVADITAGLQLDHWPTNPGNTSGTGNTLSVTVSFPIMVHHSFEGELARAISDSEAASEALQRIEANAMADWDRMNADINGAKSRLQLLQSEQIPRAEKVARAAELGYAKGALSVLELLDARRMLRQTRLDLLAARADLAQSVLTRNLWITSK